MATVRYNSEMTPSQSAPSLSTIPPGGSGAASLSYQSPGGASGQTPPVGGVTLPRTNLSAQNARQIAELFQRVVRCGDEEQARQVAARLARQHAQLEVFIDTSSQNSLEQEIKMKVYVEDQDSWGSFVTLRVKHSTTIARLKRKMLEEYGFPPEVQKWIVGRRMPSDSETLSKCGITSSGSSVFLYLVAAQSVGLDKKTYKEKYGHLFNNQPGIHEMTTRQSVGRAGTPQEEPEGSHDFTVQSGATASNVEVQSGAPHVETTPNRTSPTHRRYSGTTSPSHTPGGQPTRRGSPTHRPGGQQEEGSTGEDQAVKEARKIGWSCEQCTFQNLPTRPGCEICGHDRPTGYRVPDNAPVPPEEQRRLKMEQELEAQYKKTQSILARQQGRAEAERTTGGGGGAYLSSEEYEEILELSNRYNELAAAPFLTEHQLNLLLKLNDAVNQIRSRQEVALINNRGQGQGHQQGQIHRHGNNGPPGEFIGPGQYDNLVHSLENWSLLEDGSVMDSDGLDEVNQGSIGGQSGVSEATQESLNEVTPDVSLQLDSDSSELNTQRDSDENN